MKKFLRPLGLALLYCFCCGFSANANGIQGDQPDGVSLQAAQKLSQAIIGVPPSLVSGIYGDSLRIYAYATSGLPLSYSSADTGVARMETTATDTLLVLTGVGATTITITQPGNDTYEPAEPVTFSVEVEEKGIDIAALPVVMVRGYTPNQDVLKNYFVANGFISIQDSLEMKALAYLDFDNVSILPEGVYPDKVVVNVISLPANYKVAGNAKKATLTIEKDESYLKIDTLIVNGVKYPAPNDRLNVQTPCSEGILLQDTTNIIVQVSPVIYEVSVSINDSTEIYKANPNLTAGICVIPAQRLDIGEHSLSITIKARTGIDIKTREYVLHIDQPIDTTGVFIQRWHNVLTVVNNPSRINEERVRQLQDPYPQFDGVYKFEAVCIDKHSQDEITSSWDSYYYEPEGFDPTAEYRVTLYYIESLDRKMITVCPHTVSLPMDMETLALVYPTVIEPGGTISVEITTTERSSTQRIDIYNTMGMRILSVPLNASVNQVTMPAISGHYVIKVMGKEFKVIVR